LSESDSAIARLNGIIENSDDSLKVLRAAYARAFIYDEFLNDPETAEEYYMEIMEKYPDSEYAKQAQVNLGMRVTLKTQEDLAHDKFLAAESLWLEAKALPLEMMDAVDSAYAKALNAYDSVYLEFPKTNAGIQALYMSAMLYSSFPSGLDSAAAKLRLIRDVAPTSPWGKSAAVMLSGRVSISDEDLIRMRKRIEQNEVRSSELSKQYYDSFKQEKKEDKVEVKSKEEEILENTYNSMYDFE
jgi:tetratricopeptide (TPR) repeat protein